MSNTANTSKVHVPRNLRYQQARDNLLKAAISHAKRPSDEVLADNLTKAAIELWEALGADGLVG